MFSLEDLQERMKQLSEMACEKMDIEADDSEAFGFGIVALFDPDGNAMTDMHFCCSAHMILAAASIKEVLLRVACEIDDTMTEDEAEELFEEASQGQQIFRNIDELQEDGHGGIGGWLDNVDLGEDT